jgi:hypothetical protein
MTPALSRATPAVKYGFAAAAMLNPQAQKWISAETRSKKAMRGVDWCQETNPSAVWDNVLGGV